MATFIESIDDVEINCPLCGSTVESTTLGRRGLTVEQLHITEGYIREGKFGYILSLIDNVLSNVDPNRLGPELETQVSLGEVTKNLIAARTEISEINSRLSAPKVIGDAGELIAAKDLKSMYPEDEFSEEKATSKGADIVATVKENGRIWGTIVVSVKYRDKWSKEHEEQVRKNMGQETTKFALLVTKSFPKDALNENGYDKSNNPGEMLWLVKPEYAKYAYGSIRYALIQGKKAAAILKEEEARFQAQQGIIQVVKEWINGDGLVNTVHRLGEAQRRSTESSQILEDIRAYMTKKCENGKKLQEELRDDLEIAKNALQDLKNFLEGRNPKEEGK